jgi:hypothetical protein
MDLEATCDFCLRPIVDASVNSEIIEFPWVIPYSAHTHEHAQDLTKRPYMLCGIRR